MIKWYAFLPGVHPEFFKFEDKSFFINFKGLSCCSQRSVLSFTEVELPKKNIDFDKTVLETMGGF